MATNTFDKKIRIDSVESLRKLLQVMSNESPERVLSKHPFSERDRDRSEELLRQCLSRSGQ